MGRKLKIFSRIWKISWHKTCDSMCQRYGCITGFNDAMGLKPGDEVIAPSFTFVATTEVIALLGLTPFS